LHPFTFDHTLAAKGNLPEVTVKIHVQFGLHTFTRPIMADSHPDDDYRDNREVRCFCFERHAQSHRLPSIVRELPTKREIFLCRSMSGIVNYAVFAAEGGPTYAVFFDLKLLKSEGPDAVLLTVESAYELDPGKGKATEGTMAFNALIGHTLRGTKAKPPARARHGRR